MYDLTTRIAEIEAELKQSTRYPYTYAADAIRSEISEPLSRSEASSLMHNFAAATNVEPFDVAVHLANLYVLRDAIEAAISEATADVRSSISQWVDRITTAPNTTAKEG